MWWKSPKGLQALTILAMVAIIVLPAAAQKTGNPDKPIKNLQFQSADINSVLTFLADYGGVNVVVAPEVEGTVTIKLHDVKWHEAMDIIGSTYGLAIVDEPNNYIRVIRAEDYRKEVMEQKEHAQKTRELAKLETKIIYISNSTSSDIVEAVKSLMTERGKATSDPRSNSIIVQEVPSNMNKVLKYIKELDRAAKQIKISAKLLEVYTNNLNELGISWSASGTYTTESGRNYSQNGEIDAARSPDVVGSYSIAALQNGWSIDAVVQAIVSNGKGKIVAQPEITTVDNKEARIQMGQKIPVKQFDESGNVVIKFEEVGTILKVTPHITAENQILMHLIPERSTYQFDPNGVIINTNNAETNLIVNDGQTAMIGGLTTEDEVESEVGLPLLKDVPLLGRLFKFTNKRTEVRNLIIFVTPKIVTGSDLAMKEKDK
ncbi:MAG: secretin N-terminal domain-containing protein [candidate division Zixibacteria bacterium]|nr:secretin N-terminal domain-containing protein [candidate division Zixibacteria bacterium]